MKNRLYKHISQNIKQLAQSSYTGPEIQKNITQYGILIDGEVVTNRLSWVYGDETISLNNWPTRALIDYSHIKMVFEDKNYRVIYKPCGIPVQPGNGHTEHNLLSYLLETYQDQRDIFEVESSDLSATNNNQVSAGIVHRLDKDTEGLILIAKNIVAFNYAQSQFKLREVAKEYLTLLSGKLESIMDVSGYQMRNPRNPVKQLFISNSKHIENTTNIKPVAPQKDKHLWSFKAGNKDIKVQNVKVDNDLKFSHSIFTPIKSLKIGAGDNDDEVTLCSVQILTGRMHQIRLHAQSMGCNVYNDQMYNSKDAMVDKLSLSTYIKENDSKPSPLSLSEDINISKIFETHNLQSPSNFYLLSNYISLPESKELGIKKLDVRIF